MQASGSLFDHVPAQIAGAILGVMLTAVIGFLARLQRSVAQLSERIAVLENEQVHAEELWDRLEKKLDAIETRIDVRMHGIATEMKALTREIHGEFMGCPNHHGGTSPGR